MAINDYEADATELLETYGMLEVLLYFEPNSTISLLQDFLMKYIIIGGCGISSQAFVHETHYFSYEGEAGTGKSCLLHHFTHNSCTLLRVFWYQ